MLPDRIHPTRDPRHAHHPGVNPIPMVWSEFACVDFINSEFNDHTGSGRRFDRLPLEEWQRAFLNRWKLEAPVPAGAAQVAELRRLRARLRTILEHTPTGKDLDRGAVHYMNRQLASAPFVFKIGSPGGLVIVPVRNNWNRVTAELVRSTVDLLTGQDRRRLKVCANPDCSWMFYDESMNRSRRWCQANYCGNLLKVREFRARQGLGIGTRDRR
jgi:predicted RNA-binding Zn ribbon-like protein